MDLSWPIFVAATALLCAVTAAASRWWHGKQLSALAARLAKSERAREYAAQHASQARKQIEKLQREISEARRAAAGTAPVQRAAMAATHLSEMKTPPLPANGFADTQPL